MELNNLRIATPCPISWEGMHGDTAVRFCGHCQLNVYNISAMTSRETEELIRSKEGRICGRLYRRADGTVLSKDCPLGLRALRQRVSRRAAAIFAAVASLSSVAFGQQSSEKTQKSWPETRITRKSADKNLGAPVLSGTVIDPMGAVIAGARILLTNLKTKETKTASSNEEGRFLFASVVPGEYSLKTEAIAFKTHQLKNLVVEEGKLLNIEISLKIEGNVGFVGLLTLDTPLIDRPAGTVIISGDYIRRLPF